MTTILDALREVTTAGLVLEAVAAGALVMTLVVFAVAWPSLPDRVPQHFGLTGRPDAWGGRRIMWVYPIGSFVLYVGLWVVSVWSLRHFAASAELARVLESCAAARALITFMHLVLTERTIAVATQRASGLGRWFLPAALLGWLLGWVLHSIHYRGLP